MPPCPIKAIPAPTTQGAKRAVDELTAGGMQFDAVPAAELARMRQATQGVVNRVLQTYDPTMVKLLQTELERVKKIK